MSLSSSSLSVGQMVFIKHASNTLCLRKFSGALLIMFHVNLWVGFSFKLLAGSDLLFLSSCSFHQTDFTATKMIYNGTSQSAKESGSSVFVNITFNLNVKVRGNFLCPVQFIDNTISFVYHWDFWYRIYREYLHLVVHLSCNFAVTSTISVSRNLVGFNSKFSFIFWCYEFNAL